MRAAFAILAWTLGGCGRIYFDPRADAGDASEPGRTFAYVTPTPGTTALAILDVAADGSLGDAEVKRFDPGVPILRITGHPAGGVVYASAASSILVLAIDPMSGQLTLLQTVPGPQFADALAFHPSQPWVYATDGMTVRGYTIAADGQLAEMPSSPFAVSATFVSSIAIHPTQSRAYILEGSTNSDVLAYRIDPGTGALEAVAFATWQFTDSSPHVLLLDASGRYGYIAPDINGGIPGFTIAPDGTMSTTPGSEFPAEANTTVYADIDRTQRRVFFANQGSTALSLQAFYIEDTGNLRQLSGSPAPHVEEGVIIGVETSPVSDDVYVTHYNYSPSITRYRATDTVLTKGEAILLEDGADQVAIVQAR